MQSPLTGSNHMLSFNLCVAWPTIPPPPPPPPLHIDVWIEITVAYKRKSYWLKKYIGCSNIDIHDKIWILCFSTHVFASFVKKNWFILLRYDHIIPCSHQSIVEVVSHKFLLFINNIMIVSKIHLVWFGNFLMILGYLFLMASLYVEFNLQFIYE